MSKHRQIVHDPEIYRARRQKLLDQLGGAPLLLRAAPTQLRNGDVQYSYRQDSNFYYLTGFEEPESVLLAIPELNGRKKSHRTILFVRPKNKEREIWDGARCGTRGAIKDFGAHESYPIEELSERFQALSQDWNQLAHGLGADPQFDAELLGHFSKRFSGRPRRNQGIPQIIDPRPALHAMRCKKDAHEVEIMQVAADITAEGHITAMAVAEPGMYEFELQAEMEAAFRHGGSPRNGYDSILASGNNANTLHYIENKRRMRSGDLVLIDAGAEFGHYSADVTRTFPVNGTFTEAQKAVYSAVLRVQKKCARALKPGMSYKRWTELAARELCKELLGLGALRGRADTAFKKHSYRDFYMHGLGHYLGMDVHDCGAYETPEGKPITFEPGMVLTIEPGLYFATNNKKAPKELRGIGVRIEDNYLVTKDGNRNLTEAIPKEIRDVEALCQGRG
ncbi:MAG: Xaa-Pro aminopeptidase [Planctomycetota bacterium]|nr:MAG: Xaa-Pro aminopeptidase [Planctomycetota bacterium]